MVNYRTPGAAKYMRVSTGKMIKDRREGRGPNYVKVDRVIIYRQLDLDLYLEQHLQKPQVAK